jgi:hypothetical protein
MIVLICLIKDSRLSLDVDTHPRQSISVNVTDLFQIIHYILNVMVRAPYSLYSQDSNLFFRQFFGNPETKSPCYRP